MHLWLLLWLSGFHAVISKPFDDTSDQPNRNLPGDTDIKASFQKDLQHH